MFRFTQIPRRLPPPSLEAGGGDCGEGSCRGACRKAKPKIKRLAVPAKNGGAECGLTHPRSTPIA